MWRPNDPQGNESAKVKYDIVPYTRGRGLDIGCGPFKAYSHFIGVDNGNHDEKFGWNNKADVISEATDLSLFADDSLDFIFSSHLLEHIQDMELALSEWWRVIKTGGHLVLYLPDDKLYPKVGEPGANPDHKHNLNQNKVISLMRKVGHWDLVENELRDHDNGAGQLGNEYSFYQVYRKRDDKKHTAKKKVNRKKACVVRYGGIGDMIQTSSVLHGLKEKGYHITMMTTPNGHHILKSDPYIDDFIIQDRDQVPNQELSAYFAIWSKKFDKFYNLCESIEGTLLAMPGRTLYEYPKELRHQMCNVNYLERTHDICEVNHKFKPQFYPTKDEIKDAKDTLEPIKDKKLIMWSMSGSSMHKVTPYYDLTIKKVLEEFPNAHFILVGDSMCQIMEGEDWDEETVWCRSGKWDIRKSLTIAQMCDIVIGAETGLLNAVGHEQNHKIVALSHSTEENLTKYWKNTKVVKPWSECHPCHKLHYGNGSCPWVDMGIGPGENAPACIVEIDQNEFYQGIVDVIGESDVNVGQL